MEPGWTEEQRAPQSADGRGRGGWSGPGQHLGGHRPSHSQTGNAWAIESKQLIPQLLLQVTDDLW